MSGEEPQSGKTPYYVHCFVCGKENRQGLAVNFHTTGDGEVVTEFVPRPEHQGYPGACHGGIIFALLDETIGRATYRDNRMTVTASMTVRYRKPVPIGQKVKIVGRLMADHGRMLEAEGEAVLEDGTVAVTAGGKFVPLGEDEQKQVEQVLDWE